MTSSSRFISRSTVKITKIMAVPNIVPMTWFWWENIPTWIAFIWKFLIMEIKSIFYRNIIIGIIQNLFWNTFITWNTFLNQDKNYDLYKCNWKLIWDCNCRVLTPWLLFLMLNINSVRLITQEEIVWQETTTF